jgi:hypothetical protein
LGHLALIHYATVNKIVIIVQHAHLTIKKENAKIQPAYAQVIDAVNLQELIQWENQHVHALHKHNFAQIASLLMEFV